MVSDVFRRAAEKKVIEDGARADEEEVRTKVRLAREEILEKLYGALGELSSDLTAHGVTFEWGLRNSKKVIFLRKGHCLNIISYSGPFPRGLRGQVLRPGCFEAYGGYENEVRIGENDLLRLEKRLGESVDEAIGVIADSLVVNGGLSAHSPHVAFFRELEDTDYYRHIQDEPRYALLRLP